MYTPTQKEMEEMGFEIKYTPNEYEKKEGDIQLMYAIFHMEVNIYYWGDTSLNKWTIRGSTFYPQSR